MSTSSPSVGPSCAHLVPRTLTNADLPLLIVAPGQDVQYARFTFDKQPSVVTISPASPSTSVHICQACTVDPGTCPVVTNGSETRSTLDGDSAWTMQTGGDWIAVRLAAP